MFCAFDCIRKFTTTIETNPAVVLLSFAMVLLYYNPGLLWRTTSNAQVVRLLLGGAVSSLLLEQVAVHPPDGTIGVGTVSTTATLSSVLLGGNTNSSLSSNQSLEEVISHPRSITLFSSSLIGLASIWASMFLAPRALTPVPWDSAVNRAFSSSYARMRLFTSSKANRAFLISGCSSCPCADN